MKKYLCQESISVEHMSQVEEGLELHTIEKNQSQTFW